jgi:prefoldin subunit 5
MVFKEDVEKIINKFRKEIEKATESIGKIEEKITEKQNDILILEEAAENLPQKQSDLEGIELSKG